MATLVLTVAGTVLGGPIGGAIGAFVGQQADRAIFGGGGNAEGPRLKELDVQTSSYGNNIPAIFGAMRVAGTVIWATNLIERQQKSGGGKGRPSTTTYSYTVSLAVALSSRPILRIGRIWADGNLLRGAAGDLKVQTGLRIYSGHGDQKPDPLIASAQGPGQAPAFRGLSYVVFEDLQLTDFGNRIPSMTFEVFERNGGVSLVDIVQSVAKDPILGGSDEILTGYALEGDDGRSALAPLLSAMPVMIRPKGESLELVDWKVDVPVVVANVAAMVNGRALDRPTRQLAPAGKIPQSLSLRHYDPARDYQTGVQKSDRRSVGRNMVRIDLPAAIPANNARRLADLQLMQRQHNQSIWEVYATDSEQMVSVGDRIWDDEGRGTWRINEIEHLRGAMRISAARAIGGGPQISINVDPPFAVSAPDNLVGPTALIAADVPAFGTIDPGQPIIAIAAAGREAGWRRAALSIRQGDGLIDLGGSASPAIMGESINILPAHTPYLVDDQNIIEVKLLNDAMILRAGGGDPLANDADMIWLGGEIIRYGVAEYLGDNEYRISKLMRGCFGTENRIGTHNLGDEFLLFESETIRQITDINQYYGQELQVEAMGVGDIVPVTRNIPVTGAATKPFAPVHGIGRYDGDGNLNLGWVRRARINYGWHDGVDHPLVEDSEQYSIILRLTAEGDGGNILASWTSSQPHLQISGAEMAVLAIEAGDELTCSVRQIGRYAVSDPLYIAVRVPV